MKCCNTEIYWSDSEEPVKCKVFIDDDKNACYLHTKYFEDDDVNGVKRWRSTPSPWDRKKVNDRSTNARYITKIYNKWLDMWRPIHDENTD